MALSDLPPMERPNETKIKNIPKDWNYGRRHKDPSTRIKGLINDPRKADTKGQ